MRKHWDQKEGILLQAIPYLEGKRILKVFTKDAGLLLLIARVKAAPFAIPFCKAEWVYRISSHEMHLLKEGSLLDPMLKLKESFSLIEAAGSIASDVLRSQLPNKASPILYELLSSSLLHLPCNPMAIAQSFRIKLLQLEGLIHLEEHGVQCSSPSPSFSNEEWSLFQTLGHARRYIELSNLKIPQTLIQKTKELFTLALR